MSKDPIKPVPSDREQTNESLRTERGDIDRMVQRLADVDATADAAITRARARADAVLAAARAKTDGVFRDVGAQPQASAVLIQARSLEDRALRDERTEANQALDDARTETISRLATERNDTDRDLSTERAQSDEVLATRDEVLRIVGHELRNILTTITGMASLIAETDSADAEHGVGADARLIIRAAARMNRLLGDLSDVASIEAGTLKLTHEMTEPAAIVNEAIDAFRALASERHVILESVVAAPLPRVWCDPARIHQVLANLLSNAIKFTPPNGTVTVSVDSTGDELRFSVRDTGIGIAPGLLVAVFGRNVQLLENDRRGAGLGLYISRSIIRQHAGRIWVESIVGKGSTFFFTLPVPRSRTSGHQPVG